MLRSTYKNNLYIKLKNNYNSYERTADYFAVLFYTSINK